MTQNIKEEKEVDEYFSKDNGFEPYIPSVHLKNVSPGDWLDSPDGSDFLRKLEDFEDQIQQAIECLSDKEAEMQRIREALSILFTYAKG